MKKLLFLTVLFLAPVCSQNRVPTPVSLVQLLANPEKYEGKLVVVKGFLSFDEHGDMICLSQEDYWHEIPENGISVERTKQMAKDMEKLDETYVLVIGVFSSKAPAPGRFRPIGGITGVTKCEVWSRPEHPLRKRFRDMPNPIRKP